MDYVFVATDDLVNFSSESSSDLSVVTEFFFFASFGGTRVAFSFFEAVEIVRAFSYFPKPVAIDLGTLDLGLFFFGDEWLDFTIEADFLGPPISSAGTEKGDTFDGGSQQHLSFLAFLVMIGSP